jgi:hypothetical protein
MDLTDSLCHVGVASQPKQSKTCRSKVIRLHAWKLSLWMPTRNCTSGCSMTFDSPSTMCSFSMDEFRSRGPLFGHSGSRITTTTLQNISCFGQSDKRTNLHCSHSLYSEDNNRSWKGRHLKGVQTCMYTQRCVQICPSVL